MKLSRTTLNLWRKAAQLAICALAFAPLFAATAFAQTAKTPHADFQYSTVTGTTNTVNVTRVPSVNAEGTISYWDISVVFDSDATTGEPAVDSSTVKASPKLYVNNFKQGTYIAPSTYFAGSGLIALTGPGVTNGGATEWSVATASGANACTAPGSATFYVGPIASNPLYSRLKAAGITSTAYSYGLDGGDTCDGDWWLGGGILGFAQTGNALTIVSFSFAGTDYPTAGATVTYTLK